MRSARVRPSLDRRLRPEGTADTEASNVSRCHKGRGFPGAVSICQNLEHRCPVPEGLSASTLSAGPCYVGLPSASSSDHLEASSLWPSGNTPHPLPPHLEFAVLTSAHYLRECCDFLSSCLCQLRWPLCPLSGPRGLPMFFPDLRRAGTASHTWAPILRFMTARLDPCARGKHVPV